MQSDLENIISLNDLLLMEEDEELGEVDVVHQVVVPKDSNYTLPEDKNDAFIHLLYRPGHYDILYTK